MSGGGVEGLLASKPGDWVIVRKSTALEIDPAYLSEPQVQLHGTIIDGQG